ncbi:hypothetical protein [Stackebrandtia soli]|uniref:hypothetical protein n=1 Tax=Stackebrandtia soli TaxID=1892856 RepID=UPI0039EC2027
MQQSLGTLIGAVFGTVFIFVNAGDPLPVAVAMALQILAGIGLVVVIVGGIAAHRRTGDAPTRSAPPMFGGRYWIVVVLEAVAILGGAALLKELGAPVEATVAWVALVVGVHFIPLASVWKEASMLIPAYALTVLGAAGIIMAFTSAAPWTPIVAGVASGVVLLGGCLYSTIHSLRTA